MIILFLSDGIDDFMESFLFFQILFSNDRDRRFMSMDDKFSGMFFLPDGIDDLSSGILILSSSFFYRME